VADASAKVPDGLLNGHFINPGNMEECLDLVVDKPTVNKPAVTPFRLFKN
jgi:hypothetical protein